MEKTFKKGDRVRLKAWVAPRRASVLGRLFEQGWVGVVQNSKHYSEGVVIAVHHCHNDEKPLGQSFVYVEDLELMPERQVHIVKDGKVYELRDSQGGPGVGDCQTCAFRGTKCVEFAPVDCVERWGSYKEVTSGKLVS